MSKASQALQLFEQGNSPVQVAIKLDINTGEVDKLYREYWNLKGLYNLLQVYAELKDNTFSFVKLYRQTKKEGMGPQQVINALKIAEKIPNLEAERQYIEDCIDDDGPKILELNKRKVSLAKLRSILEEVESALEYRSNQLKSTQEELESAREHANNEIKREQEKLDRQKASLASEVDKYKEILANEVATAQNHAISEHNNSKECLLVIQKEVKKRKQEEQQLTSRIERLKNEELQEQYVHRPQ